MIIHVNINIILSYLIINEQKFHLHHVFLSSIRQVKIYMSNSQNCIITHSKTIPHSLRNKLTEMILMKKIVFEKFPSKYAE